MAERFSKAIGTLKRNPNERKQRPRGGNHRSPRYKTIVVRGDAGYSGAPPGLKVTGGSTRRIHGTKRHSIFSIEAFNVEGFSRTDSSTSIAEHRTSIMPLKPLCNPQNFHFKVLDVHKQPVIGTVPTTVVSEPGHYKYKHSTVLSSGQLVSCLCFLPEKTGSDKQRLVSGSWDSTLTVWNANDENGLTMERQFEFSNTVSGVSCHSQFIATGSTSIQLYDIEKFELSQTLTDRTHHDESLEDPPLHLVVYTPDGDLVSASVENNVVKIWPLASPHAASPEAMVQPKACFTMEESEGEFGCIYRLALCPSASELWLAVVVQPGKLFFPSGSKKIHLYSLKEGKFYNTIDAEHGGLEVGVHVAFSFDGRFLYTGYKDEVIKREIPSGNLIMRISLDNEDGITCLTCSPDGLHLAVGLVSGDVAMLDASKGNNLFILRESDWKNRSAVTSMAYSQDSSTLATGHEKGAIYVWTRIPEKKTSE